MTANQLTKSRIEHVVNVMPILLGNAKAGSTAAAQLPAEASLPELLSDYYRVMEIAHFVRRGGIKAMIYRLETGRTKFVPVDYFDDAHQRLLECYQDVFKPSPSNDQSLIERLKQVSTEEEQTVSAFLPRLDDLLLASKRQEAVLADELHGSI